MRTSRVSATTSSVFRQEQQYLHAGDLSHNFSQNPQKQFKNRLQKIKRRRIVQRLLQQIHNHINRSHLAM